ncbi:ribosomal-protein-alanine N-acetyltransferase [Cycloclasticus sp. 46_120_T64]|nr:ribosomal-protein-alanine N-acetyltransferase [Cycloclasticus sp. 46_120_T64]
MAIWQDFKDKLGLGEKPALFLRPLKERDLQHVLRIEREMYDYPWSEDIFRDCLRVAYSNWALIKDEQFIGYAILSIAVGEAHILNICLDKQYTGQGLGRHFLAELLDMAKGKEAARIFLEVRQSNTVAINLYQTMGFKKIGQRKKYYQAADGREDAMVLSLEIADAER